MELIMTKSRFDPIFAICLLLIVGGAAAAALGTQAYAVAPHTTLEDQARAAYTFALADMPHR
jgi:hypothetical protein